MSRPGALCIGGFAWAMAFAAWGQGTGYVRVEGDHFLDENGDPFYPMVCNYFVHMPYQGTPPDILTCRVVPGFGNAFNPNGDGWGEQGLEQAVKRIENDFHQVKSMGFNAIRLMSVLKYEYDPDIGDVALFTRQHVFPPTYLGSSDRSFPFLQPYANDPGVEHVLNQIALILDKAALAGLKVILVPVQGSETFSTWDGVIKLIEVLQLFGDRFKEHPALMAYDLYNEPAYFDLYDHTKEWICEKVEAVYDELKTADPNHLITVGGISVVEVFEWDPTILKLDFWSPHLYPIYQSRRTITYAQALENVHSQLTWLQNNMGGAWMIGEFGFVANDAEPLHLVYGTEAEQASFTAAVLQMTRDAGAAGFSWWTFGDVFHYPEPPVIDDDTNHPIGTEGYFGDVKKFYENNFGLLHQGDPANCDPLTGICDYSQLEKPIVSVFTDYLDPLSGQPPPRGPALVAGPNYFNPAFHPPSAYTISGQVTGSGAQPIKDAVVRGATWLTWVPEYNLDGLPIFGSGGVYYDYFTSFTDDQGEFALRPFDYHGSDFLNGTQQPDKVEWLGITAPAVERIYRGFGHPVVQDNQTYSLLQHTFLPHRVIQDVTLPMGGGQTYWEAWGTITMSNVQIEGNGSTGASADITARRTINLKHETHLARGTEVHIFPSETFAECEDLDGFRRPEPSTGSTSTVGGSRDRDRFIDLAVHTDPPAPITLVAYPNPAAGVVCVEIRATDLLGLENCELHVVNLLGQQVHRCKASLKREIDLTGWVSGAYSVQLFTRGVNVATTRLIIQTSVP